MATSAYFCLIALIIAAESGEAGEIDGAFSVRQLPVLPPDVGHVGGAL
jgi:hypothetical protein